MVKVSLVALMALLLTGCTGETPYSAVLVEEGLLEVSPTMTAQTVALAEEDTSAPLATPTEDVATSPTPEPVDPVLPGADLFTFTAGEPGWYTVNDDVMGGVSNSTVQIAGQDNLLFSGTMSLENNGGFASVRSQWRPTDLSHADGILLRVLGDGKSYRLRIRTTETGRDISYNALFETTPETWRLVYIPFADMVPTYFGYVIDGGAINPASIASFGFMLSDKQPGEFGLLVDWMRAVSEEDLLSLLNAR